MEMKGQELKIIFIQDRAYLTTDRSMSFEQVRLPITAKSFMSPAFWTIKVISYREEEKKIYCEVISYQIGETEFGYKQKLLADKLNELEIVTFRSIDTAGLISTLYGTTKHILGDRTLNHYQSNYLDRTPVKQTIKETFFVPFKNVHFKNGYVSFDKRIKGYKETLELTITNNNIREEFDAVKNYFANILKTKNRSYCKH